LINLLIPKCPVWSWYSEINYSTKDLGITICPSAVLSKPLLYRNLLSVELDASYLTLYKEISYSCKICKDSKSKAEENKLVVCNVCKEWDECKPRSMGNLDNASEA
jgi:hypothetical protein